MDGLPIQDLGLPDNFKREKADLFININCVEFVKKADL